VIYQAYQNTKAGILKAVHQEIAITGTLRAIAAFRVLQKQPADRPDSVFEVCDDASLLSPKVPEAQESARSIHGVASVEEISRSNLRIDVDGIDLRGFRKNPVVLAAHTSITAASMPGIIGSVGSVAKRDGMLVFRNMLFDDDPLSEAWFQKIVKGLCRMVSIGIVPVEYEYVEETEKGKDQRTIRYIRVLKSELLEISPVAVGANRGAFIDPSSLPKTEAEALQHVVVKLCKDVATLKRTIQGDPSDDDCDESYENESFPDTEFVRNLTTLWELNEAMNETGQELMAMASQFGASKEK